MLLFACRASTYAQSQPRGDSLEENKINSENILESLMSYSDDVSEMSAKVDLNAASVEDLLSIPEMTSDFVASIVSYRRRVNFIFTVDELSTLDGATPAQLSSLKAYARILPEENFRLSMTSYSSLSPEKVSLYQAACGDNGIANFQKVRVEYRNLEFIAITDKDAGENSYLDFYSLSLSVKRVPVFSAIDIGNYCLSLGNGILFSNGTTISKSAGPISPLFSENAYSLRPDRSRSESGFLRGGAFEIPSGTLSFTGFLSSEDLKAHFDKSGFVTSIDCTGLNLGSNSGSSYLKQKIAGGILRCVLPYADFGATGVYFSYDRPFANYYVQRQLAGDAFMRLQSERAAFSGEILGDKVVSFSANTSLGYDAGEFAVGVRNLRSRIFPNYSGTLSENFPTSPEQGIYFGTKFRPAEIVKLGLYYDRFRIMSTSGEPDRNGEEIFADSYVDLDRLDIFDGTATVVYIRYRYKTKEDFYIPETEFATGQSTLAGSKQNFRIDLRHNFSSALSVRARFEKNFLSSGEKGELFLLDAAWSSNVVSIDSRICSYRTDTYNSAFYEVEEDLPGVSRYMLMYGDGSRLAILARTKIGRSFSIGMKVSRDLYAGAKEVAVGSSSDLFSGTTYVSVEFDYEIE